MHDDLFSPWIRCLFWDGHCPSIVASWVPSGFPPEAPRTFLCLWCLWIALEPHHGYIFLSPLSSTLQALPTWNLLSFLKTGWLGRGFTVIFCTSISSSLQACFLSLWELLSTVVITCSASLRASLLHVCRPLSLAGVSQDYCSALSSSSLACSSLASTMLSVYQIFYLTHPDDCSCQYLFISFMAFTTYIHNSEKIEHVYKIKQFKIFDAVPCLWETFSKRGGKGSVLALVTGIWGSSRVAASTMLGWLPLPKGHLPVSCHLILASASSCHCDCLFVNHDLWVDGRKTLQGPERQSKPF